MTTARIPTLGAIARSTRCLGHMFQRAIGHASTHGGCSKRRMGRRSSFEIAPSPNCMVPSNQMPQLKHGRPRSFSAAVGRDAAPTIFVVVPTAETRAGPEFAPNGPFGFPPGAAGPPSAYVAGVADQIQFEPRESLHVRSTCWREDPRNYSDPGKSGMRSEIDH